MDPEKKAEEKDRERKNLNFVQFDRRSMAAHRALIRKSPLAAELLTLFAELMDRKNALVISYRAMEEITGYKRSSIGKAIKVLKEGKWVQALRVGSASAYVVNSCAFWSTWANGKSYSHFSAAVVLSAEEQKDSVEKMKSIKLQRMPIMYADEGERPVIGNEELPPPDQQDLDLD